MSDIRFEEMLINNLKEELKELKHQLAQKDKQLEKLKSENHTLISDNAYQEADMFEFNSRIEQLQKQLAEKDHTINTLIEDHKASQEWYKKQLAEKEKENEVLAKTLRMTKYIEKEINQDKISFALEQLEKVKDFCDGMKWAMVHLTKENTQTIQTVLDEIDNQIKAIKGDEVIC